MMSEWCQSSALVQTSPTSNAAKGGPPAEDMTSNNKVPPSTTFPVCKPPKKRYLEDMNHATSPALNHQSKFSKPMEPTNEGGRRKNGTAEEQPLNLCMEKEKTITGSQGSLISRMVDKLFCDNHGSSGTLLDSFLQQMSAHSKPYPEPSSTPPSANNNHHQHKKPNRRLPKSLRPPEYTHHHKKSGAETGAKNKKHSTSSTSADTRQASPILHNLDGPYISSSSSGGGSPSSALAASIKQGSSV